MPQASVWTDELIARLTELWHQSEPTLSCAQIAAEIGVTRNAVIGKSSRLGLPLRAKKKVARAPRPSRAKTEHATAPKLPPIIIHLDSLQLTLMELQRGQCRYPTTEDGPYLFCGQPQQGESSYCPFHHHVTHDLSGEARRRSRVRKPPTFVKYGVAA